MIALLGKKLGMTRVYDASGNAVPVTVVQVGQNKVVQVRTVEKDGYSAIQVGIEPQKEQRLTKPLQGHFKKAGVAPAKKLGEIRNFSLPVKVGDSIEADIFAEGDWVDAIGTSKGRGFEGVVKRHGFRGGDSTHGAKGWHRRSGAIGQRLFPGTVMRGMKMPGHMGQVRRTTQNLRVVRVQKEDGLLLIRGAIPGAEGDYVVIREAKKHPKKPAAAA